MGAFAGPIPALIPALVDAFEMQIESEEILFASGGGRGACFIIPSFRY